LADTAEKNMFSSGFRINRPFDDGKTNANKSDLNNAKNYNRGKSMKP